MIGIMLVSYKWLKQLVDVDVPSEELAEKMSTTGIEVEGVESPADGLSKIVVGEVLSCEDVPETHLHVCQVNVGEEEARQIVCGAPNVCAGIKVMVALPGARIADNYKIKKGKIRGSAFCIIIHRWRVIHGKNTKKEGFQKKYIGILFLILQSGARTAKKRLENMDFVSMNGCFVILI